MKKIYLSLSSIVLSGIFFSFVTSARAQAFHKGSFLIGLSEGSTWSNYSTEGTGHHASHEHMHGERDPITLEYGLSKSFGIGINMGADIFEVDPEKLYGTDIFYNNTKAITSELTIDANYHFYVTDKTDLSLVGSLGGSSVTIKGNVNDQSYQYIAGGGMVRLGLHAKYYFWDRLGFQLMGSIYSSNNSPKDVKGNTFGQLTSTSIKGKAIELGLCFRLGRLESK